MVRLSITVDASQNTGRHYLYLTLRVTDGRMFVLAFERGHEAGVVSFNAWQSTLNRQGHQRRSDANEALAYAGDVRG